MHEQEWETEAEGDHEWVWLGEKVVVVVGDGV